MLNETNGQQAHAEGSKVPAEGDKNALLAGWRKINGRAPEPEPPINTPVLVVACAFIEPAVEIMAWTGDGWSNGAYGHWERKTNDGDHIFYWMPLPDIPSKTAAELWGGS